MGASSRSKPGKDASGAPAAAERSGLEALSEAIQSGAGLPAITRAAATALEASIALIDRSSAVLAVAAGSSAEEEKLLSSGTGVETIELRVADAVVGELRWRDRSRGSGAPVALRMVTTLLGLEVERARSPEWASDEAVHDFIKAVLRRELAAADDIAARASELGSDLSAGAGVVMARALPHAAQPGDWRARALMLTLRAVRSGSSGALASTVDGDGGEVATVIPSPDAEGIARAAKAIEEELRSALHGFSLTIGFSRHAGDPAGLYRAGKEALLAANVGEAERRSPMAFEDTGAYRLLLPALSEDPAELERFYDETVAPLAAYDDQYETELVATVEAYLDNDGNVTPTAETLFTHRHTVRYRLERVRELCGHDLTSTEGREKIGLGLKAMRVLGIPAPGGPALEPGTKGGRSRRGE
ncbi:MAG: helix-turn-helix domain-containing protein [Actinomycetota bacterium]|nr:helix-turn-helix domain-containing protein [Actinomycetota bacterium]